MFPPLPCYVVCGFGRWTSIITTGCCFISDGRIIVDDLGVSPLDAALGRAGSADNRPSDEVAEILQTAIDK